MIKQHQRAVRWSIAVILLGMMQAVNGAIYHSPDMQEDVFGGSLTIINTDRAKAATALAKLVRGKVLAAINPDMQTAARVLGLALRIDPDNVIARNLNEQLATGQLRHASPEDPSLIRSMQGDVRAVAKVVLRSHRIPDEMLADYLFSANILIEADAKDMMLVQELERTGHTISWAYADERIKTGGPAPAASVPGGDTPKKPKSQEAADERPETVLILPEDVKDPLPRPKLKQVVEVRGMVVSFGEDGLWHGRAMDIIATSSPTRMASVQTVTPVGNEMAVSIREAVRLVRLRHPEIDSAALELSFDDKYTAIDGGSAGTAFALVLLSSLGDFDLNPDAAITGDITVDSKVRQVGEVPAKVHGAALDHCKLVAVPALNSPEMEDAVVLRGPSALWETQIFSVRTIDDAIAVMRQDPKPELSQAIAMFQNLKEQWEGKSAAELAASAELKEKLKKILELAPNHVSAKGILQLAMGKHPVHLTLQTTISEAVAATSHFPINVDEKKLPEPVPAGVLRVARKNLARIKQLGDPAAVPVVNAIDDFCVSYSAFAAAANAPKPNMTLLQRLSEELQTKSDAVESTMQQVTSDREMIDKLMRS